MKVRATQSGYYGHTHYHRGDIFEISDALMPIHAVDDYGNVVKDVNGKPLVKGMASFFAKSWMEEIPEEKKEEVS